MPLGPGVRFDTHIEAGAVIPPQYDSLLGKVVVWDEDRPVAVARALRALGRAGGAWRSDHARARDRRAAQRGVRRGPVLDGVFEQAAGRPPALVS